MEYKNEKLVSIFRYDPIQPLMKAGNKSLIHFLNQEILNIHTGPEIDKSAIPEVIKIMRQQNTDGSFKSAAGKKVKNSGVKYELVETWKQLRFLIDKYKLTCENPAIKKACEYVFSCQTSEGDIRGILANQYTPYYTGAILSLLIKAGYSEDFRVHEAIQWLLSMRQDDGGWVIGSPGMLGLKRLTRKEINDLTSNDKRETAKAFDKTKAFSAAGTGMVIRAFAEHPSYRNSEHAIKAATLLKSMFFKKDNWTSYGHPDNWLRFQFPFWWTNLVSALDSISKIGFSKNDPDVKKALEWLIQKQEKSGLWKISYSGIHKNTSNSNSHESQIWITLSILRIFKRFYKL